METKESRAFPQRYEVKTNKGLEEHFELGLTIRDYFAAKAMQSMLGDIGWKTREGMTYEQDISDNAFQIADAMLKQRNI